MMDIRGVRWQDIPAWYELSWLVQPVPAVEIRLHRDFIPRFTSPEVVTYLKRIKKEVPVELGLGPFATDINGDFGFSSCMRRQPENGEWVPFRMELPCVRQVEGQCLDCNGTGKNEGEKCWHCGGGGERYSFEQMPLVALLATYGVLMPVLSHFDPPCTSALRPQLMAVELCADPREHRYAIGGEFGPSLAKWFRALGPGTPFPEVVAAMIAADRQMCGEEPNKYSFQARVLHASGFYAADCPGDACGVHASHHDMNPEEGYEFTCHNVDTPIQMVTLLAGLAALSDTARQLMR